MKSHCRTAERLSKFFASLVGHRLPGEHLHLFRFSETQGLSGKERGFRSLSWIAEVAEANAHQAKSLAALGADPIQ